MRIAEIQAGNVAFSSVHGGLHRPRAMKPRRTNRATNALQKIRAVGKEVEDPDDYIKAIIKKTKSSGSRIQYIIKSIIRG